MFFDLPMYRNILQYDPAYSSETDTNQTKEEWQNTVKEQLKKKL